MSIFVIENLVALVGVIFRMIGESIHQHSGIPHKDGPGFQGDIQPLMGIEGNRVGQSQGRKFRRRGVPLHVDACFGGFILPWLERLGVAMPPWDFRVDGVTSISADVHKYGYAAKGASTVLYRSRDLYRPQFFLYDEWPGGLYGSSTGLASFAIILAAIFWTLLWGPVGLFLATVPVMRERS